MTITYRPKGQLHKLTVVRAWTHLIKMPGLRGNPHVEVECRGEMVRSVLLTPRRVRVHCAIRINTDEIEVTPSSNRVRWKHIPGQIACTSSEAILENIIHIPDQCPAAKKLQNIDIETSLEKATTLRDRLIIKGIAKFTIEYIVN